MHPPQHRSAPAPSALSLRTALQGALGNKLVIERPFAEGASAHLFIATETALARRVVLKVLPLELSTGLDAARFRREIELAAKLAHPNIVPVLSAGEGGEFLYYTMPFVEGESLHACLKREGALALGGVVAIVRDVARALAFAHTHGVVHRDVKPDNVLLELGAGLLTDFGIAKAIAAAQPALDRTGSGIALGTPIYVSPEQAAGDPGADHRSDLYSLGVVAYEMLAGHPPFAYANLRALLAAHRAELPPPLSGAGLAVPSWLDGLVMRLLAKRPGDRPRTADAVVDELNAAITVAA